MTAFQGIAWTKRWHPCMMVVVMRMKSENGMGVGSHVVMCHSFSIPSAISNLQSFSAP